MAPGLEPASHIGFGHRLRSDQVAVKDNWG